MWMEAVCGVLLSVGMLGLACWMLVAAFRWVKRGGTRLLLVMAALSLLVSMALAVLYSLREWLGTEGLDIPRMARIHGPANALGFGLAAMVAWHLETPASWMPPKGIPWSRLAAGRWVGPDFFDRCDLLDEEAEPALGLVDDMSVYQGSRLNVDLLNPAIRGFYENTGQAWLKVTADWQPGFRLGGFLFSLLARRIGQLNLPLNSEQPKDVSSRIARVKENQDGRAGARAWIRTARQDGSAIYMAVYAHHRWNEVPYMNIAFPLPLGNMTSVLHLCAWGPGENTDGLALSTAPAECITAPDAGVYWVSWFGVIRLPLNETIRVWNDPIAGVVRATHDMWFFRWRYLRLTYTLGTDGASSASGSASGSSASDGSA